MNQEPPSLEERHLAELVAGAYDALTPPEPAQLAGIEARVAQALPPRQGRRRPPVWYWWLIGALAVSGAAAWWAGSYLLRGGPPEPTEQHVPVETEPTVRSGSSDSARGRGGESRRDAGPEQSGNEATIYRRERY